MWSNDEQKTIHEVLGSRGTPIEIIFHLPGTDTPLERVFTAFFEQLAAMDLLDLHLKRDDGKGLPAAPSFTINNRLHYAAQPTSHQFAPFLEVLTNLREKERSECSGTERALITDPAELLIFIAPTCPHCPQIVRQVNRLVVANEVLLGSVVDVQAFPDLASSFGVRAVPLVVLDQGLSFVGTVDEQTLLQAILSRSEADFGVKLLRSLVENGRLSAAARHLASPAGPEHFLTNWRTSDTSLRMGLLLAVEQRLEEDEQALDGVVGALLPTLEVADAALRGDTADLLGRIGHRGAIAALRTLLNDENPDVREIASDALDEIEQKTDR